MVLMACGGDGSSAPDGATGDGAPSGKKIFVTSADFTAGFAFGMIDADGAALADQQCQSAAVGAGLGGTWKAWLSRSPTLDVPGRTAPERITGEGPWHLVGSNELVFLNRAALANTPRVPINRNELGVLIASGNVWTGTDVGGSYGVRGDCNQWTTSNSGVSGTVGRLDVTTSEWTAVSAGQACGQRAHLYCLEM